MPSLGQHRIDTLGRHVFTLRDDDGAVIDLSGVVQASASLVAYPGEPALATLAAAVADPPEDGRILLTIPQDLAIPPSDYLVYLTVTVDGEPIDAAADTTVEVAGGVGTAIPETPRVVLERMIATDLGPLMSLCGLSTSRAGSNRDLDPGIGWAYRGIGLTPASGRFPTDDEIGAVGSSFYAMVDLVTYRVLLACRSRWTFVTTRTSQGQGNFRELRQDLEIRIQQMEMMPAVKKAIAMGTDALEGGGIGMADLYAPACPPGPQHGTWCGPRWRP